MARPEKALSTPADDGFDPQRLEEAGEAAKQLATLQQGYGQGRDLVNQLLGQAQAFQAAGDLLRTFGVSKLAIVKENKLYQQLAGSKTPNGSELKGTWVEFCSLLGISDDKANQDIANLQAFGEEALEQMQRVGIGYRDLRQFRKLPEDQKTALIEAAKVGDKDTLLELAEDLIAKHAKEKEALAKQVEEIAADKEATERVAQLKQDTINKLQHDVAKLSNPLTVKPWNERVAPFQKEITERQSLLVAAINQHKEAVKALDAWLTSEITSQPDYDPESPVELPPAVRAVVLHLDDAVARTATLAAELQHELRLRFGADIDEARQHVLTEGV